MPPPPMRPPRRRRRRKIVTLVVAVLLLAAAAAAGIVLWLINRNQAGTGADDPQGPSSSNVATGDAPPADIQPVDIDMRLYQGQPYDKVRIQLERLGLHPEQMPAAGTSGQPGTVVDITPKRPNRGDQVIVTVVPASDGPGSDRGQDN